MTLTEAILIVTNFQEIKGYIYTSVVNEAFDMVLKAAISMVNKNEIE